MPRSPPVAMPSTIVKITMAVPSLNSDSASTITASRGIHTQGSEDRQHADRVGGRYQRAEYHCTDKFDRTGHQLIYAPPHQQRGQKCRDHQPRNCQREYQRASTPNFGERGLKGRLENQARQHLEEQQFLRQVRARVRSADCPAPGRPAPTLWRKANAPGLRSPPRRRRWRAAAARLSSGCATTGRALAVACTAKVCHGYAGGRQIPGRMAPPS